MFTGFPTINSPAVQTWDVFNGSAANISLANDCAPIQIFKTGGSLNPVIVYLPTYPVEGQIIRIFNYGWGSSDQSIDIYASDQSQSQMGSRMYQIGQGSRLELIYTKNAISYSSAGGNSRTGWVSLNITARSAYGADGIAAGDNCGTKSGFTFVAGGSGNKISNNSQYSFIGAGQNNTITAANSVILGGESSSASGQYSSIVGGSANSVSSTYATIVGGVSNNATTATSGIFAAQNSTANANGSCVIGGLRGQTRSIQGVIVNSGIDPVASSNGVSQTTSIILGKQTTDATATRLASNSSAAATTNQLTLPNNSAYTFQGTVIANVTGAGNTSSWKFEGAIKRGANAASTVLVAAVTPTVIAQDAGAAAWVVAVTADTTLGCLNVTVTGAASTTIRWVCKIETTEVTF